LAAEGSPKTSQETHGFQIQPQNDGLTEPVRIVLFLRHHRQRQFDNLAEPFQAFSYLPESVDFDGNL
jgi:hypothetical protein